MCDRCGVWGHGYRGLERGAILEAFLAGNEKTPLGRMPMGAMHFGWKGGRHPCADMPWRGVGVHRVPLSGVCWGFVGMRDGTPGFTYPARAIAWEEGAL